MHGQGQGLGNGGTHWMFISVPMMEIANKVAPGCTIQLPKGKATWTIRMMAFVDDKRHYTNTFTPTTQCHSHKSNGKICFHLV